MLLIDFGEWFNIKMVVSEKTAVNIKRLNVVFVKLQRKICETAVEKMTIRWLMVALHFEQSFKACFGFIWQQQFNQASLSYKFVDKIN